MRVVVAAVGSSGNANPFLGLAKSLVRRGHEVIVISDEARREQVNQLGAQLRPIVGFNSQLEGQKSGSGSSLSILRRLHTEQAHLIEEVFDACVDSHSPGQTVMVAANWVFGARLAQEHLDVPMVSVALQPLALPPDESQLPFLRRYLRRVALRVVDRRINRVLGPLRHRVGLAQVRNIYQSWSFSPNGTLAFFPEWFAQDKFFGPQPAIPVGFPLYDGGKQQELSAETRHFLDQGAPPLVFAQSSLGTREMREFFEIAIASATRLNRRAVLLSSNPTAIPQSLPANVAYFGFVPVSQLLPHACAFVHHAGLGMIAQGLKAGVPQVTVPGFLDQPDNARHLQALGVSASISRRRLTCPRLCQALESVLDQAEIWNSCRTRSLQMAGIDAFELAADVIEAQIPRKAPLLAG